MAPIYRVGERIGTSKYEILEEPHRGSMAFSYIARSPAGDKVFLKEFNDPTPLSDWYRPFIAYQAELKRRVEGGDFRNFCYRFVEFFEFAQKPGRPYYHQVFEFVPNGLSLTAALEKAAENPASLSWDRRVIMAKVMMAGVKIMHAAGIVHSDLKPDNVILIPVDPKSSTTAYKLRLIDLDFSLLADRAPPWLGHDGHGYFGTEGYLSPEHRGGTGPTPVSDVFTCGLMLYELLSREGRPYRQHEKPADYFNALKAYKVRPPTLLGTLPAPASTEAVQKVIHRCLDPDPGDRPTAEEVHKTLLGTAGPPPLPKAIPVSGGVPPARPRRLVLRSAAGTSLDFGMKMDVNRELCKALGDEARFLADPCQFTVERDGTGWVVVPAARTTNQTLLNGKQVTTRTALKAGDVIGVGNAAKGIVKLPLTVGFID